MHSPANGKMATTVDNSKTNRNKNKLFACFLKFRHGSAISALFFMTQSRNINFPLLLNQVSSTETVTDITIITNITEPIRII